MSPACSPMATLHHLPACTLLPTSLALDLMEGRGPGRRHCAETSGLGRLDSCTCILAKDARVGRVSTRKPRQWVSAPGLPHIDTCSCVGWRVCPREATAVRGCPARESARVQCGTARSGPLKHPARVLYYSVTFFYFTLIMIIQEYYLSDKFRVSFLIYNFLLC